MTQEELYEAIDATIAPNGQRGITAESLAALLKDIAANAGGSGQGALRVYGVYQEPSSTGMQLNQELIDQMNAMVAGLGDGVTALMQSNANAYQQIKNSTMESKEAPLVMLDCGALQMVLMKAMMEVYPEIAGTEEVTVLSTFPVELFSRYTKTENGEVFELYLLPVVNVAVAPSAGQRAKYILMEDGSIGYVPAT